MTEEQQTALGQVLWDISNKLRGSMNADDFRDYILSFLFLKYLSDNYEAVAKDEMKKDYPQDVEGETPLQAYYRMKPNKVEALEKMMKRKIHYIIKPDHLWDNIASMADKEDESLLQTLEEGFDFIEEKSFGDSFRGLFSEINLDSDKLGKTNTQRNKKISEVINALDNKLAEFDADQDTLGDAYEYLIGKFAANAGKKAGEFYTPQEVSTILSTIVSLDAQDPSKGKKKHLKRVLDLTCGSGSLLLNVRNQMGRGGIGTIYGQESNITTYNLARMNMLLHGMNHSKFEIHHGDSLENDWDILNNDNVVNNISFEAVVSNPPFSLSWEHSDKLREDPRFKNYGLAPKQKADMAFLLHGLHYLDKEGTMAIILPHGVLYRDNAEARIREKLLEDDNIDAIIGLPANLFYSTGIPVCVVVLKKCKNNGAKNNVLIIDAKKGFEKKGKLNYLRERHIGKIIDVYQHREEVEKYSRKVTIEEIRENQYNLNIPRYIDNFETEQVIELGKLEAEALSLEEKLKELNKRTKKYLKEIKNEKY